MDLPAGFLILAAGFAALAAFVVVERRAPAPVLPLWIFRRRLLVTSGLISVGIGAILTGLSSYVPTYVQDALGTGPLIAGFALATLTLGWPITGSQAGRVYLRLGFRACALIGTTLVLIGCTLLLVLGRHSPVWQVAAICLVIGLGMGLTASPTLIAAQSSVDWAERGVVTGSNIFLRSVGSSVGVAVFGAIANATVGSGAVSPDALTTAVHRIFIGVLIIAVLILAMAAFIPHSADRAINEAPATEPAA
ncbi:MFS transporter [Paractinoplanes durhamensis]|uniref:MFS transporter n=1 Tax=Paractinoplanes durhamensis TaxID=113563 RepID=UPI00363CBDC5